MPVNRSFTKIQKERARQERASAKRQKRSEKGRQGSGGQAGSGPPIDFAAREAHLAEARPDEDEPS